LTPLFLLFLAFEDDLELAVRYEANAAEYFEDHEYHDLKEIEEFLDNIKSVRKQIQLEQCNELEAEFQKSAKWLQKYQKYFKLNANTGSEPSLHVAKALLELSDDLSIQPSEVNFYKCPCCNKGVVPANPANPGGGTR
jgi:hypothetical protein